MSAAEKSYFVFEPLMKVTLNDTPIDEVLEYQNNENAIKIVQYLFENLYSCKPIPWLHLEKSSPGMNDKKRHCRILLIFNN